mmetsp:Transcript_73692/g.175479  ORF Transcript_73692/g.175479 Transcript_73692/m.175479 type:complete len:86 (+) Transcript_73692:169-426(+)
MIVALAGKRTQAPTAPYEVGIHGMSASSSSARLASSLSRGDQRHRAQLPVMLLEEQRLAQVRSENRRHDGEGAAIDIEEVAVRVR